ncbi:MAG: ATP-binding cassette domain-containing protein [Bacteroidales bacterium]|jgi:ABC-2 type transport system ATP-binding protein|nr:ATP-binding cassette domain-containing protein [Bacteroidales bacterium]
MFTLIIENIEKKFETHKALDNVSFNIPENCIFGLLGPNGAGKTTLIRIINQITAPDSGSILMNGEKLSSKHISSIGYLPEERGLYPKMKVGEQALYLCQLKGMTKNDAMKELKKWFEKFEIQEWWGKKIEELSKGMQQKVQFITTVLHKPKLLILDEPFSGFDPINANLLKQEILEIKKQGSTIVLSTHNMTSVEEICDNIVLINKSKKVLEGNVEQIRKDNSSMMYNIEYHGNFDKLLPTLTSDYKIVEINTTQLGGNIKIEVLNKELTNNILLERMMQFGSISSFREDIPTMDKIFIKTVQKNKIQN